MLYRSLYYKVVWRCYTDLRTSDPKFMISRWSIGTSLVVHQSNPGLVLCELNLLFRPLCELCRDSLLIINCPRCLRYYYLTFAIVPVSCLCASVSTSPWVLILVFVLLVVSLSFLYTYETKLHLFLTLTFYILFLFVSLRLGQNSGSFF